MSKTSIYLKLARKIASDERDGIERRYEYGAELLKARAGRQRLPKGFLADRITENERAGLPKISEGELQRYMRLAEVYPTKAHRRHAMTLMGSWFEIVQQNFPEVTVDVDADQVDDAEILPAADAWEQPSLIPGLKSEINVNGKKLPLAEALVADGEAYEQMCVEKHEGFGKTVAQIQESMRLVRIGCQGDRSMRLVDAYQRGIDAGSAVS